MRGKSVRRQGDTVSTAGVAVGEESFTECVVERVRDARSGEGRVERLFRGGEAASIGGIHVGGVVNKSSGS